MPRQAGMGAVEYTAQVTEHHTAHTLSPEVVINGNTWYPVSWHEDTFVVRPEQGWTIDTSKTPKLLVKHEHGKHSQSIISVSANAIVVHYSTYCGSGKDIGIFRMQVEFDQFLDQTAEKKRIQTFDMNWKDSQLLEPQGNEIITKLVFDDYKGVHQEYGAPDTTMGVLKSQAEGNGKWKIWAEPPKDLTLAAADLSKELKDKLEMVQKLQHLKMIANLPKDLRIEPKSEKIVPVKKEEELVPASPEPVKFDNTLKTSQNEESKQEK